VSVGEFQRGAIAWDRERVGVETLGGAQRPVIRVKNVVHSAAGVAIQRIEMTTYLAQGFGNARVRPDMRAAIQGRTDPAPSVWLRSVLAISPRGNKSECVFTDGTSILISSFLASFIRPGDELRVPTDISAWDAATEIHIRSTDPKDRRRDVFRAEIGYAGQPRKDMRDTLFVTSEIRSPHLGISAIHFRCDVLRDYFYIGNRRRSWDRQPSFYELLRVDPRVSPEDLRVAFRLRSLELRTAGAPVGDIRTLERAFNILAQPELRSCYNRLLADSSSPALFPHGGFGSLIVSGDLSRDGAIFYASRILSFLPGMSTKTIQAPMRKCVFYEDLMKYRDSRRNLEILLDQAAVPLLWDPTWNQWKHLLGATICVKAPFVQNGRYRHRKGEWELETWQSPLPSRIEVTLPENAPGQIAEARRTHHRFGKFAEVIDEIRVRLETAPLERNQLREVCDGLGIPGDFDVSLITWKPDYDDFYYKQLFRRARRLYLFRSEYIFDLERAVIVETPQLGHATYVFTKPAAMTNFLSVYRLVTRVDILRNRNNVAEKLGFLCRLVHGSSPGSWLKELKSRLGETFAHGPTGEET
jgi:hypothetical protein